jgi:hypothetical protein
LKIARLLVSVVIGVRELAQPAAVDPDLEEPRHFLRRPDALPEIAAHALFGAKHLRGRLVARAQRLAHIGKDQLVRLPRKIQTAQMSRAELALQQGADRRSGRETRLHENVAAGGVDIPATDRDVAVAP